MPKDSVGQLIEVGDILLSASKTGNIKIGRVEKIFPSGHITLKFADRRIIYAWMDGAPLVPGKEYRQLKNEDGTPKTEDGRWRASGRTGGFEQVPVYGHVDAMVRDQTLVRREWYWRQGEAAHYSRFVIKSISDHPLFDLNKHLEMDYDADAPQLG